MYKKSGTIMQFTAWVVIYAFLMLSSGVAFAGNPAPLSAVPIPTPPNLGDFVKNKEAAIKLGKALFWDMNVGGDGIQACATCHYRAGADPLDIRAQNQLNPGPNDIFDVLPASPNATLTLGLFPFLQVFDPATAELKKGLNITNNQDDVVGSQGVSFHSFVSLQTGSAVDIGTPVSQPHFGNSRRVTGRNTPPAVNAVFNYANFWDGRANNIFNGSSPIGPLDASAGIWVNIAGDTDQPVLEFQKVAIPNASLASQAVGPPNNDTEMSWAGRTFPQLGRKLLNNGLTPLGQQLVSPQDSMLGDISNSPANGINKTYAEMIQAAFYAKYWNSSAANINGFTQMEANFSLFWGLSVMLYESTLVSDQTPFDKYLEGNVLAMSDNQIKGFGVFQSKCEKCHSGSETTDASVSNALAKGLIEKGVTASGSNAISDVGFHNIGIRLTAEDIGRAGIGGSPNPIASFAGEAIAQANGTLPFTAPQAIFGGITANSPVAVKGTFKTPHLRNVALNAPYMHNGSIATLAEVVDFYARGGNFLNAERSNLMDMPVGIGATDRAALVDFLQNALTDPRVAAESAPFDHPELRIPSGDVADNLIIRPVTSNLDNIDMAAILNKPAETGTLANLPKAEIFGAPSGVTNNTGATITVGGADVVSWKYKFDSDPVYSAETLTNAAVQWNSLINGPHKVSVIGKNAAGNWQLEASATTASWTVDTNPPVVAISPVTTNTKNATQTISGTVDTPGSTVAVHVDTGAAVGPVTVSGTTWTCQVSGLKNGNNNITVTATDAVGNSGNAGTLIKIVIADGCFRGTGSPDVTDALKALRISVGIVVATADDKLHGDVNVDGNIDSGDALLILKKATGLVSF
jgi:cytochrome c peroxidase